MAVLITAVVTMMTAESKQFDASKLYLNRFLQLLDLQESIKVRLCIMPIKHGLSKSRKKPKRVDKHLFEYNFYI